MANNNTGKNQIQIPEAKKAMEQFKMEVANELGIANYDTVDKGNLTARQNGYVGGNMVKKMIQTIEQQNFK
ncbi:alpha/beta-type small acid-soluble spore protein [Garciella nitratireducens]|uniref:Small, acid-soluble spore protein, alpha/beta type n=1 Tax=Garciella nitratireducens DSM 15102 TaxID=1121911 RepID=A0A1T4KA09_9FIRM|nr:alpha/beta-type small acid-soluble spore protein [Garciella nitratireducens]RBP46727.1 small acid-soluble spore protein alpha/beta type [Garciella nitratireducens]SJZ39280.1 Small, acid-soluble spore protein, alpha/beta type [Garciella nitratireducens DSM 15102]